jgi:hypothetical protein
MARPLVLAVALGDVLCVYAIVKYLALRSPTTRLERIESFEAVHFLKIGRTVVLYLARVWLLAFALAVPVVSLLVAAVILGCAAIERQFMALGVNPGWTAWAGMILVVAGLGCLYVVFKAILRKMKQRPYLQD